MYKFEVGESYKPYDACFDSIKVIKRTPKMIQVMNPEGNIWRMRIRIDNNGNEYATDSCVPLKWRTAFTYCAEWKVM